MQNKIQTLLYSLGICDEQSFELFYPKVRDRDDISVMRCRKCGVICLSRSDHLDLSSYEKKKEFRYQSPYDRKQTVLSGLEDLHRRAAQFQSIISNKKWLDVGAGAGGILDILGPVASETVAVEPREEARNELLKCGYQVYRDVESVPTSNFQVVTLFHVLEHLIEPIETLKAIREKMVYGGKLIVEVPHANDFLISFLEVDEFKAFTFWSEHLILHTRQSLNIMLAVSGFKSIIVQGYQRYPLANHLYWLARKKPGGHQAWSLLRTPELDHAYSQLLASLDKTDTLIAVAEK